MVVYHYCMGTVGHSPLLVILCSGLYSLTGGEPVWGGRISAWWAGRSGGWWRTSYSGRRATRSKIISAQHNRPQNAKTCAGVPHMVDIMTGRLGRG